MGPYFEFKVDADLADTYGNISERQAESWNDPLLREEWKTISVSAGGTRSFGHLYIYLAAGVAYQVLYSEYEDPTGILADDNTYWIYDENSGRYRPNVTGGFGVRAGSLTFQFGGDAVPAGISLGIGYAF